ncbi:MAG: RNA-binding protein [Euryarchaeota archaeon]|nr:RNA-binding protein [Euryarchaeota archaeon]
MTARTSTCTASGMPLVDARSTSFPCPECGHAIGRSRRCRLQGVPYVCTECGFQGP